MSPLDNVEILSQRDISIFNLKAFVRLFISIIEMVMAQANITGSQSDIVHYLICLIYGQLIFRLFECIEYFSPSSKKYCQIYHIQSLSMMIFFT